MKRWSRLILLAGAAVACLAGIAAKPKPLPVSKPPFEPGAEPPFVPGEVMAYGLSWGVFSVGSAMFKVLPMTDIEGERAYHFIMEARTNGFADAFYKVRDRIDSYVAEDLTRTLYFTKKQREGRHRRDIVVTFDWEKETAQYTNFGESRKPVRIGPVIYDPLGVFYAIRLAAMDGDKVEAPVTDGKRVSTGAMRIVRREELKVKGKTYKTILVEPDLKNIRGVFKKSKNAKLQIWFSDDERCIPVKVSSKVAVGSFVAQLISDTPGGEPADE